MKAQVSGSQRSPRLVSLPNGNESYLVSLNKYLSWINTSSKPSRNTFIEWLVKEEGISKNSAPNYWQMLGRLGLLEKEVPLRLSVFGDALLSKSLRDQSEMLFPKIYQDFRGVAEIANLYVKYPDKDLHIREIIDQLSNQFSDWKSYTPYESCIHWLASLGFIEGTSPRFYKLSDNGRQMAEKFIITTGLDILKRIKLSYGRYLVQELLSAARDGEQYIRFEEIVKEALIFLGFQAKHIGVIGDTDVIAKSTIPENQYTIIFDTKARGVGKLTAFNLDSVIKHKKDNLADYAVVVAENFTQGNLAKYAEERGIILMRADLLCEWIALHCEMPLNLVAYHAFFTVSGILSEIPKSIQLAHQLKKSWINIVNEVIEMAEINANKNLMIGKSIESLQTALTLHLEHSLERKQVMEIIELFTHPALSWAVSHSDGGMLVSMNRSNVILGLRELATALELQKQKK